LEFDAMADDDDQAWALARYQVISAYLALEPQRGQRALLLMKLAARNWRGPGGEDFCVAAETIRVWVRRYRAGGLERLRDKPRPRRGVSVLAPGEIERIVQLKRDVPERSLDRLLRIAEGAGIIEPGRLRRSTLHRILAAHHLSARPAAKTADASDLDRFEADAPNDLWQSDMLVGPWLPDPERPGKVRRAYLYAFLDDHSRLILHGRFSFRGDLPALELVFRRCLQKWGKPRRCYYDNGQVYRSGHMRHIVAALGLHALVFTKVKRPQGHGKIEALNRLIRSAVLAELRASSITTLDALNEAFTAWVEVEYNRGVHGETGEPPLDRWRRGVDKVKYADEEALRQAFLWREERTPDKAGVFSLFGVKYQTRLGRKRIQVRYDPETLELVELWHQDRFVERVRPFEVSTHRRPQPSPAATPVKDAPPPLVDWLGHLVARRKREFLAHEREPRKLVEAAAAQRAAADQAIVDLFAHRLDEAVFCEATVRDWLARFGPIDPAAAEQLLAGLLAHGVRKDQHITFFLDALRRQLTGGTP
jgi:putative transposase